VRSINGLHPATSGAGMRTSRASPHSGLRMCLARLLFGFSWASIFLRIESDDDPHLLSQTEQEQLQRQIAVTDRHINELVYELYDLTPEEIAVVEGK
jgi:hypothetical protein